MSASDFDLMQHALRALDPNPNRVRRYPSELPVDDAELRDRLLREARDEPREPSYSNFDRDTGIPKTGPI